MEISRITSVEFGALRAEWNDLLSRSASDNVFLRWEWIHTWWTVFKGNRRLAILTAREDGRLVGIAPLYIEQDIPGGIRTLKLCSEELAPDYMDMIVEKEWGTEIIRQLVNGIRHRAHEWDVISFDNLLADSASLTDSTLIEGYFQTVEPAHTCPYIEIRGTFADYLRMQPQLSRFCLDKKVKKLRERLNVDYIVAKDETSVSKGLDDLFDLHEMRSHDKNVESNFKSADVQRFHHDLSHYFLNNGILNLQLLYHGKTPISAVYAFNYKNKVYAYQTGFDPRWSKWSVGAALFYLGIEKAFKDGRDEFDLLKGTEHYKSLWSNAQRKERHLTVYRKTLYGTFQYGRHHLKSGLRRIKTSLVAA